MAPVCEIQFENQDPADPVYVSDDTLKCKIILNLDKPEIIKGILVTILGRAECSWTERRTYGNQRNYFGQEEYLNSGMYLVGGATNDEFELSAGIHTYGFEHHLMWNLPSSIEGDKGHIRYNVCVTINRTSPLLDDNYKRDFTLKTQYNLNSQIEDLAMPSENRLNHTFSCCSKRLALFSVVASVSQIGYVPGQFIKVKIEANNTSSVTINAIKTSLCQIIEYTSTEPYFAKTIQFKEVAVSLIAGIPANQTQSCELVICVPSVPPSDEERRVIIRVTYCIKLRFKTNWLHTSPTMLIPITIGTIPLGHMMERLLDEDIYDSPVRHIKMPPDENTLDTVEKI